MGREAFHHLTLYAHDHRFTFFCWLAPQLICSMVQYYGWARIAIIYSNDTYGVNSYTSMLQLMPRYVYEWQ